MGPFYYSDEAANLDLRLDFSPVILSVVEIRQATSLLSSMSLFSSDFLCRLISILSVTSDIDSLSHSFLPLPSSTINNSVDLPDTLSSAQESMTQGKQSWVQFEARDDVLLLLFGLPL